MCGCEATLGPKDPRRMAETAHQWHDRLLRLEGLRGSANAGQYGTPVNPDRSVTSLVKRKAVSQHIHESPLKRRKSLGGQMAIQPSKALGSMTNFLDNTGTRGQRRPGTMPSLLMTSQVLSKDQSRHVGQEDRAMRAIQVAPQYPILPASPERTAAFPAFPSAPPMSSISPSSNLAPRRKPESSSQEIKNMLTQSPLPGGPLAAAASLPVMSPTQAPSRETSNAVALARFPVPYWPQDYIHTPIVRFLQNAYVWIPRDANNKRPANRPPALQLIPQNRRIGVIYFLLIICGCRVEVGSCVYQKSPEQFTHVDKCVVFVKTGDEPEIQEGLNWLLGAFESWRTELNELGKKELLVFDSEMLSFHSLATFHGDIASQALWSSSRMVE